MKQKKDIIKQKKDKKFKYLYFRSRHFNSLSFKRDKSFIPNLILCLGVVFVWRGMRNLMDIYFFPNNEFISNILAIIIGIFFIYLPDNSFYPLGGFKNKELLEKGIAKEVSDILKK